MVWRYSGLLFGNLQSYTHILSAAKNVAHGTWPSFWQNKVYADIRRGMERGRQLRVGSLKMAIFAYFVHCLPNILHNGLTTAFT